MIKLKDLIDISDGNIASLDIEGDEHTYYQDGTIIRDLGKIGIGGVHQWEHTKLNEKFEDFLKKYYDYEVTHIDAELDGNGIMTCVRKVE